MHTRLQTRLEKARSDESGFTLIELLIVIIVLGILAGIVVFGVSTFKSDSELAACKATKKTVEVASDAHFAKNSSYVAVGDLITANYLKAPAPAGVSVNTTTGVVTATGC